MSEVNCRKVDGIKVGMIQNVTLNDHRSVYSHNMACELRERGVEADLILQKTHEPLQYTHRPYRLLQVPGQTYSVRGQIQFVTASLPVMKRGFYDIVHAKNPFSSVFSPVVLKEVGAIRSKIIYDMRGLWIDFGILSGKIPPYLGPFLKRMESLLMGRCDHLIAISPKLKEILCFQGIEEERISVIGEAVDIKTVEAVNPPEKGDFNLIGYVGTISVSRQSDKIIEAFKKLKRKDTKLVMVGPVMEPSFFRPLVDENIALTGFLPQEKAFRMMKSFDVAVAYHDIDHPVYNVAVPIKILEYMAAGIPVVATDHCMYRNILENGRTAVLTGKKTEDFALGMARLLDNPNEAKRMADAARIEVKRHSAKRLAEQLESIYARLLE